MSAAAAASSVSSLKKNSVKPAHAASVVQSMS
jgi:hypothetical protein